MNVQSGRKRSYPSLSDFVSCATVYGAPPTPVAIIHLPHLNLSLILLINNQWQKLMESHVVLACFFVHAAVPTIQMVVSSHIHTTSIPKQNFSGQKPLELETWPETTTATHIGDRQNSLSARRIPPKFSWLLGPSVVTEKNRRWKLEPKQQATFVEVKNHLTSLPLPRRPVFTRSFIMEIGKSKEALKTLVSQ
ncbi:hypothetical protein T11_7737 [Trichinella zimbabwensis]|uniref:Uncharacterized protein n=1 Tax=Trichinella zimbabwensis TaxID=268475 RepID=A0A0V1HM48_9BILA|nr:hypothetical protein T11_7737 [Trichinella zimbabwensis]